tara:strand:+ start:820 stop:1161 length:342 start_codon:yes stop_codon:yes gene_type:complete
VKVIYRLKENKIMTSKIENKLYHTKEIKELMNKVALDYVEQVALMKDEELSYDRGAWITEFALDDDRGRVGENGYDVDIHTLSILIEQLRRFGRIWYEKNHDHHIFDSKIKTK